MLYSVTVNGESARPFTQRNTTFKLLFLYVNVTQCYNKLESSWVMGCLTKIKKLNCNKNR